MLSAPEATKRCSRCGMTLPMSRFNASAEFGHQYWCRECQSDWYREHRHQHIANVNANTDRYRDRNRRFVLEYLLSHPCVDCGEADPMLLEFDHVRGKVRAVSRLKWSASPERIMAEIERCEVRCVNCHMKRTAAQFGWRKAKEAHGDEDLFQVRP